MRISKINIKKFKGLSNVNIENLAEINVFIGKNNAGKSSILHAVDFLGLALENSQWDRFQPKLSIKDMISDAGEFEIAVNYDEGSSVAVKMHENGTSPAFSPKDTDSLKYKSVLIWPDVNSLITRRRHRTPKNVLELINQRNFSEINGLQIMNCIRFFGSQNLHGLTSVDYENLVSEIRAFFPELDDIQSSRTDVDIDTLIYTENGQKRDIIYSGAGLRQFIDVLIKVVISNARIILLDEPEAGLHPDIQRKFVGYLNKLVKEKNVQIFISTHSPVFLNELDPLNCYRIVNTSGERKVTQIQSDAFHTVLGDLGLRPSDVFNRDICILVEGSVDIIFFEHLINTVYAEDFGDVSVAILQYGGSAADGIINGTIDVSNIVAAQGHVFWFRDRDAEPANQPSTEATKFCNAITKQAMKCHIHDKREIEYYLSENVLKDAQEDPKTKVVAVKKALATLNGSQSKKFRTAAGKNFVVPRGKLLRKLLKKHMNEKVCFDLKLRTVIEKEILPWKKEILGQ